MVKEIDSCFSFEQLPSSEIQIILSAILTLLTDSIFFTSRAYCAIQIGGFYIYIYEYLKSNYILPKRRKTDVSYIYNY